MVMDRPTRGVALGGVSVGVGAVCQTVADHLATSRSLLPSVWLERGGRLRCVASAGAWPRRDGISATAGVIGATFTSGVETVVPDLADASAEAHVPSRAPERFTTLGGSAAPVASACLPIRCDGCVAGVLDVELTRPVAAGDRERRRQAAADIGERIAALGGPPAESGAQRMLRHMAALAAPDEPDAIASATLTAALDLMELDSAALVRRDADGALHTVASIGPLAPALAAAPAEALEAVVHATHDASASVVVGTRADLAHPQLRPLRDAGAQALVAVGLVARAESFGVLLLAGGAERTVSIDDVELLELLAAHAATCLRTADLMRSLRERAATDPLTGLGHHATFHETLARAHRRPRTAVVLCDVDGFKRLNDTYGHQHGDGVLRGIADALDGALRRGDTLFRIGGDEFAALLAVSDPDEALEAGRRLREAVAATDLGVTVSIGVAVPRDGEPDSSLLARADRALYRVKGEGR